MRLTLIWLAVERVAVARLHAAAPARVPATPPKPARVRVTALLNLLYPKRRNPLPVSAAVQAWAELRVAAWVELQVAAWAELLVELRVGASKYHLPRHSPGAL